jgi:hypothetical protein
MSTSSVAASRIRACHTGPSTTKTSLPRSMFARRACAARTGGRWGRSCRSTASSHSARRTGSLASPPSKRVDAQPAARWTGVAGGGLDRERDIQPMTLHSFIDIAHRHMATAARVIDHGIHGRRFARMRACRRARRPGDAREAGTARPADGRRAARHHRAGLLPSAEYIASRPSRIQRTSWPTTRREAQREVNALAARLGELQAEANRLNALGARLTRSPSCGDGEFDFDKPVGVGGAGPCATCRRPSCAWDFAARRPVRPSDTQLSVLESLLFNRELDRNAMPSRDPIANSYITSGFGGRADPFGGGTNSTRASISKPTPAIRCWRWPMASSPTPACDPATATWSRSTTATAT